MYEFILEFLKELHNKGVSWGAVLTALLLWNKMNRNRRLRKNDERVESKINALMQERGIVWNGQPKTLRNEDLLKLKKLLQSSQGALNRVHQQRRVIKMNPNTNWITLIPALIGAIKLILQPFGIDLSHVTDNQVNDIVNGAAALATIIGIIMSHRKKPPVIVVSNIQKSGDNPQAVNHSY